MFRLIKFGRHDIIHHDYVRTSAFRTLCAHPQAYYFATTFSFDISISMRRNCTLSSCIRIRIYGRSKQLRSFIRLRLPSMRPPRNAPFHINHRVLSFAETRNYQRSRSLRFMLACFMLFILEIIKNFIERHNLSLLMQLSIIYIHVCSYLFGTLTRSVIKYIF